MNSMEIHLEKKPRIGIGNWTLMACFTVLLSVFFHNYIFQAYKITSSSMLPTLSLGDFVIVDKFTYGLYLPGISQPLFRRRMPQRGDVVVFKETQAMSVAAGRKHQLRLIKRIVAIPGDTVEMKGVIATKLSDGQYFVMGDNKTDSEDSRDFGPINFEQFEGLASAIYWSWDLNAEVENNHTSMHKRQVRWERLGNIIS